jgi:hypothetical protein
MAVVGALALGASGQVISGKLLRLSLGAAFRPGAGVTAISGVLHGPANSMGELTLLSNTQLTVQPYRAVVQNTLDATAGPYVIPNDAVATLGAAQGFSAQDATQFRRALITTYVDDAQVAGSGANQAYLLVIPGALAASSGAAALPATPNNALNLGELLIPPVGQSVTLTPYNPRTGLRGGILPVLADGSTITGHDAAPGAHVGQYRDHPTLGVQRWDSTRWRTRGTDQLGAWISFAAGAAAPTGTSWGPGFPTAYAQSPANDGLTFTTHGTVGDGFVVPVPGMYLVTWQLTLAANNGTGGWLQVASGLATALTEQGRFPMVNGVAQQSATCIVPIVTAGHFIRLLFSHTNGGTIGHASAARCIRLTEAF